MNHPHIHICGALRGSWKAWPVARCAFLLSMVLFITLLWGAPANAQTSAAAATEESSGAEAHSAAAGASPASLESGELAVFDARRSSEVSALPVSEKPEPAAANGSSEESERHSPAHGPVGESAASQSENLQKATGPASSGAELVREYKPIQYQALGGAFIMPLASELDLTPASAYALNSVNWPLLGAAWSGAALVPLDHFFYSGDYEVFLAVMAGDVSGTPVTARQDQLFLSAQQWADIHGEVKLEDIIALKEGVSAGMGFVSRDDKSLFALSARLDKAPLAAAPEAKPEEGRPEEKQTPPDKPVATIMISSLTIIDGLPVLLAVSSSNYNDINALWRICRSLTFYLRIANNAMEEGFFNPNLQNLIIAGRKLSIKVPDDYCPLRAISPKQTVFLLNLESTAQGLWHPLVAYVPCQTLKDWQEGTSAKVDSYGIIGINLEDGQLKLQDHLSSRQFLHNLQEELKGGAMFTAGQLDQADWPALLREMPVGVWEHVGHFAVDSKAGYWAVVFKPLDTRDGISAGGAWAGVVGSGLVNGLAVNSSLYMSLQEPQAFSRLLTVQKNLFKTMTR